MISSPSRDVYSHWIVRIGFIILFVTVTYQILTSYGILKSIPGLDYPYLIGILAMLLATSIDLARDFALTSRNLEKQLVQVQELSEKTIAQERLQREQEIQQRLLEEENLRKSRELEEARQLQVSMLPKPLEEYPGIEIYFHMQTATEVGGDYYDYHVSGDQALTLAIGDATGHGMRAGTMVSVIKSLFVAEGGQMDLPGFMDKCHRTIRELRLANLYMGLTLARFTDNQLSLISAGMPPVFHFRRKEGTLDELLMKVLPLGAPATLSLKPINIQMSSGDLLVFMSDGYPELFNSRQETFGIENVKRVIKENVDTPVRKIVDRLLATGDRWREDFPQKDDITFIIFKVI
jgi:serine phosphatase RsbU (regulator of sigma subunit)